MVTLSDAAPAPYTRSVRRPTAPRDRRASAPRAVLPTGRPLSGVRREARDRGLPVVVWAHVPLLLAVGLATGHPVAHTVAEVAPVACGVLATVLGRRSGTRRTEPGRLGRASAQRSLPASAVPVGAEAVRYGPRDHARLRRPDVAGLLPAQREPAATRVAARR